MRKSIAIAAAAAMALGIAGCAEQSWQEALEEEILNGEDAMTQEEIEEFCGAAALFGLDTPEKVGALVLGFAEGEDVPTGDTTVAEWVASDPEASLDDIPSSLDPDEVTVRDLVNEAGAILLGQCGFEEG